MAQQDAAPIKVPIGAGVFGAKAEAQQDAAPITVRIRECTRVCIGDASGYIEDASGYIEDASGTSGMHQDTSRMHQAAGGWAEKWR